MLSTYCVSTGTLPLVLTIVGLCMLLATGNVIQPDLRGTTEKTLIGLYEQNGKVEILTVNNFNDTVLRQNRSLIVEFYNTFCGHCQRYAPQYKALAERLYPWRETLLVAAIDCNAFENTGICRDYEIFAYPTLRYFSPGYMCKEGNYGQSINPHVDMDELVSNIAQRLAAENGTVNIPNFPSFQSVSTDDVENTLFNGLDSNKKYVILAYEPDNTTVGLESILQFHLWPDVQVRRVTDLNVANKFQIDGVHYKIATVDRQGNVVPYSVTKDTPLEYIATIQSFLEAQHFKPRSIDSKSTGVTDAGDVHNNNNAVISEVLRHKHFVYQRMAVHRKIWNVSNKANAVLWLWEAHNEVNNRLAGDATEDPKFPKIQFPSESSCSQCRKSDATSSSSKSIINWDREAVLNFLINIHNPGYVSRYGIDQESVLQPSLEKLRQKRMIGNVFSEMDMGMGMLLYLFCIVMLVVAFKLFALKGYRKKPYMHDVLGKV